VAQNDLATVDELKAVLRVQTNAEDHLLSLLLTQASEWIAAKADRKTLVAANVTEVRHGNGGAAIMLREYPVNSVASVTVDGVAVAATGWGVAGRMLMRSGGLFPRGSGNVTIVYNAGYQEIPAFLARAAVRLAAGWYRELSRIGESSKILEGQNVSYALGIPKDVADTINDIRNVVPA
jgi:uncharacterized phiE125 gp8 family phage protein